MMLEDLNYEHPPELIALEPVRPTRVALTRGQNPPEETDLDGLLSHFGDHDLLVINESKVIPARVFSQEGAEILFLQSQDPLTWEVLFPARDHKEGDVLSLPGEVKATLTHKGLPQILKLSQPVGLEYFEKHGEMALPPYIQQARGERHHRPEDPLQYQTAWARNPGSVAAPTASLHFSAEQLAKIPRVERITLHVGAGTFLPIRAERLEQHKMHKERVEVPDSVEEAILVTRQKGGRIWALGTTVTRTLESLPLKSGETDLFIYPPYKFKNVDVLLTNFHQPKSTLLALVAAFAGLDQVRRTYDWAIERRFKLFSYGDLSAWMPAPKP